MKLIFTMILMTIGLSKAMATEISINEDQILKLKNAVMKDDKARKQFYQFVSANQLQVVSYDKNGAVIKEKTISQCGYEVLSGIAGGGEGGFSAESQILMVSCSYGNEIYVGSRAQMFIFQVSTSYNSEPAEVNYKFIRSVSAQ